MTVFSISNIKGGVAKTTTCASLMAGLHKLGYRVLGIDSDPQTNLTMCFMDEPEEGTPSLYTLYKDGTDIDDLIYEIKPGLDLLAGDFELCSADFEFLGKIGTTKMLGRAIEKVRDRYDFVVIDTPPNLGFLSLSAFKASDYIITPMAADSFSLKAIRLLKKTLDEMREDTGRAIPVKGILLTKYTDRTNLSKALEDSVNDAAALLETDIFTSRIRQATVVQESQLVKMDIFEYAPKSPVAKDYEAFIAELLERIRVD